MLPTAAWHDFYVITGSASGALIGLEFVVITLIADMPVTAGGAQSYRTFGTPTIMHLSAVLLFSAVFAAPWRSVGALTWIWGILGLCGLAYVAVTAGRMRVSTAYRPEFEDWAFYALLPFVAYGLLAGFAAAARWGHLRGALFAVATAILILLFTGIHNAWDSVTYHVFVSRRRQAERQAGSSRQPRL